MRIRFITQIPSKIIAWNFSEIPQKDIYIIVPVGVTFYCFVPFSSFYFVESMDEND